VLAVKTLESFNDSEKARRNLEYLQKLDLSEEQAKRGEVVRYTMDELKALIDEA